MSCLTLKLARPACCFFLLQAAVRGERQPARVCREGEHREEEAEHEQRGAALAPPDQPPHVPGLLPTAPLLLHLPRPLVPVLLLLSRGALRLPHSLPGLPPDAAVLLALPQGCSQSESLARPGHTHSQGGGQSKLLSWPGHAHTQSANQSL